MRVFSVYFLHSEGWTPRNEALLEAVLKRATVTRHSWVVACDADMSPVDFEKSLWFQRNRMHVVAPVKASTCRSKGTKGGWIGKVHDYVIACKGPNGKSPRCRWWKTSSRGRTKQCPLWLKEKKEMQEWNEQKLPKVLPGYSGGRLPGRSTKEKGREEGEVDEDSGERRIRIEIAQEVVAGIKEKASAHDDAKATCTENSWERVKQNWDCSQIEDEEEEEDEKGKPDGDAMR